MRSGAAPGSGVLWPSQTRSQHGGVIGRGEQRHKGRLEAVIGAEDLTKVTAEQVFPIKEVIVHEHYRTEIDAALDITDSRRREIALTSVTTNNTMKPVR